jgi:hypothetical protein
VNNYTDYFGDVDLADIGFMTINFSVATEFNVRTHGAQDRYKALHPELADKVFDVDVIDMGFSVDAGFDKAAATMSANSDIKYWFVFGCRGGLRRRRGPRRRIARQAGRGAGGINRQRFLFPALGIRGGYALLGRNGPGLYDGPGRSHGGGHPGAH